MTQQIKNEWTETIAQLADENRRLSAALKLGKDVEPTRAEMDYGPVWDARVDLSRLVGIIGAVIYLVKPDEEDDPSKGDIITALVAVQETLSDLSDGLADAIKGMKILKEVPA